MSSTNGNLLEVQNLRTYFDTEDGEVKAVDGVTFQLKRGETLGIPDAPDSLAAAGRTPWLAARGTPPPA